MSKLLALFAPFATAAGLMSFGLGAPAPSAAEAKAPPGDTIVEITGDAANGFSVHHYDGSVDFPPTGSEARAECAEYSTRVARVRCRTGVRVWYRDLADTQQALDWAHGSA